MIDNNKDIAIFMPVPNKKEIKKKIKVIKKLISKQKGSEDV